MLLCVLKPQMKYSYNQAQRYCSTYGSTSIDKFQAIRLGVHSLCNGLHSRRSWAQNSEVLFTKSTAAAASRRVAGSWQQLGSRTQQQQQQHSQQNAYCNIAIITLFSEINSNLIFLLFEPMSLWYTHFTRNSGTGKLRQLRPRFLILLARHADIVKSLLYTVHGAARPADGLTAQLASLRYNTTGSPLVELIRGQNTKTLTAIS